MGSPVKIVIFAICVTAFVAFFGDKFMMLTHRVADRQQQIEQQPGNELVYDRVNRAKNAGNILIPRDRDGQYWVSLYVNGTPIRFMVDTGASHISLRYEDAEMAGLNPAALDYIYIFKTVNGVSHKAMIKLDYISLKSIEFFNIPASVSKPGQLNVSLLGMNFLNKLSGFNVENNLMVLRP